jgi:hypothetical protein
MKTIIHDGAQFQLFAQSFKSQAGVTADISSVWPLANHPEPHRLLQLTLPKEGWLRLADFAKECAG